MRPGVGSAAMGVVAVGAALVRMQSLIAPSEGQPSWFVVLAAAFVLGAVAALTGRAMRLGPLSTVALVVAGTFVVLGRILAPDTMYLAVLPTGATWGAVGAGLSSGLEYLRFATVPVRPAPDLILVIATFVAWIGATWGWLVATGRAASGALVAAGFHLAVAMADQAPTGTVWTLGTVVWVALLLMTHGAEVTRRLPGFIGEPRRVATMLAGLAVAVVSLALVQTAVQTLPAAGTLAGAGVSDLAGIRRGVSVNLFASMVQTDLVNRSDEVVFTAHVEGHPEPERLYWRLISLDRYDGSTWRPSFGQSMVGFEPADTRFRGPVTTISQSVRVEGLRQQLLPVAYAVDVVTGDEQIRAEARPRIDGAVELLGGRTRAGLEYHAVSSVPLLDVPHAVAVAPGGPPVLVERGAIPNVVDDTLTDRHRFVELPERLDPRIAALAAELTAPTDNHLEQMLLLEAFLRTSETFTYSLDIDPGHAADDLAAWLLDEDSPNHRVGYCEQFATALAVLGRTLDIPTRVVVGFAPGEATDRGELVVRGRNAHAWVEAWIDQVGWVQLDPTPQANTAPPTHAALGFDIVERAETTATTTLPTETTTTLPTEITLPESTVDDDPGADPGEGVVEQPKGSIPVVVWWLVGGVAAVGAPPVVRSIRRRRAIDAATRGDTTAIWGEVVSLLAGVDQPVTPGTTPLEVARRTSPALRPLADVHTATQWGSSPAGKAALAEAVRSFEDTEAQILEGATWRQRLGIRWWPLPAEFSRWRTRR